MRVGHGGLAAFAGRQVRNRVLHAAAIRYLGRPFPSRTAHRSRLRLCIHHEHDPISMAQVYPFLHYGRQLAAAGIDVRCAPVARLLDGHPVPQADIALVQTWFTVDPARLQRGLERARDHARTVGFIDAFAHNDLRLARVLDPYVDVCFKKSLFRDQSLYFRAFQGDTNLTEFYQQLYGLPGAPVDWQVPRGFPDKLRLSPNFFTSPALMHAFETQPLPDPASKTVDLHARLGLGPDNNSWYRRMREDALARAEALSDRRAVAGRGRVDDRRYMAELRASKLCFSPFGYGELCWRDIEAILAGAVLIKPDMGHLETLPDLYEPGVTYLPVRWDFADLEEVVETALSDGALRQAIADAARSRVVAYLRDARFVEDVALGLGNERR